MTRFYYPAQSKCRICGKAATLCDYCDTHWESEGREKVLKEAELEVLKAESEENFEDALYYKKFRCS